MVTLSICGGDNDNTGNTMVHLLKSLFRVYLAFGHGIMVVLSYFRHLQWYYGILGHNIMIHNLNTIVLQAL